MSKQDEKLMFAWTDQLELRQDDVGRMAVGTAYEVNEVNGTDDEDVEAEEHNQGSGQSQADSLARVKANTWAKLGLQPSGSITEGYTADAEITVPSMLPVVAPHPPLRLSFSKKWILALAASVLAVAIMVSIALISPEVRAQVRRVIQYIPGFATVQESGEDRIRYVLPSAVVHPIGDGKLEIRGIQIGDKLSSVVITGSGAQSGVPSFKSLELVNQEGERYMLKSGWLTWSSEWMGEFYYRGPIKVTDQMELVIEALGGERIPVSLIPAGQADRIEDLGSTSVRNGIGVTAITAPAEGDKTKVTLIPQLPAGSQLDSFGLNQYDYMMKPMLLTSSGQEAALIKDEVFPRTNEFYYPKTELDPQNYKLIIAEVRVLQKMEKPQKITVPIPAEGVQELHKRVSIQGFPMEIVKVERIKKNENGSTANNIRIYVDPQYEANAARSLLDITVDMEKLGNGYSTKFDETTRAVQFIELPIQPGVEKEQAFTINEALILYRGPWELEWGEGT